MDAVKRLLLAGILTAGVWAGIASPASAAGSSLTPAGQEGLEQVATCLKSSPNLLALLVIDASGSLADNDRDNRRIPILANFLTQLASLSGQETPLGTRKVDVAINVFAGDSQPFLPWTALDPTSAQDIGNALQTQLPDAYLPGGTNYEAAIKGARSALASGVDAFDADQAPCQLVLWFTDGGINIDNDPAASAASARVLCAATGPIDKLRREGAHLISVLLLDRTGPDFLSNTDYWEEGIAILQSTAEGVGDSGGFTRECGTVPIPDDYARGVFFEGTVDALAVQFAVAVAAGSGGSPGVVSPGDPARFSVDPGITEFRLIAQAPQGFELAAPDGTSIRVAPGETKGSVGGANFLVDWSLDTFTARVPVNPATQESWTLTRPVALGDAVVYFYSELDLVVDPVQLIADETATITGHVVTPDGSSAGLSTFQEADLTVSQVVDGIRIEDPGFELNRETGSFSGSFTPKTSSSEVYFDLTLELTTASGFKLRPLTKTFGEQVKLPGGYPQPTVQALDLGSLQDQGATSEQSLVFAGSPDGVTRVCVDGAEVLSALDGAGVTISTSPTGGCIEIAKSGELTIQVAATLGQAVADGGVVDGEVRFRLTNAKTPELGETKERGLTVPFTVQVLPVGPVLWVPFVLMAIGILLPLILLYVINHLAARLRLEGLMVAKVPVQIEMSEPGQLTRTDNAGGALITFKDLNFAGTEATARNWSPGAGTLRAKTPLNPFGTVAAEVTAPAGYVVVSNTAPVMTNDGRVAGMDLCPSMCAYILVDPEALISVAPGDTVSAELYAFLIPDNAERDAAQLSQTLRSNGSWGSSLLRLQVDLAKAKSSRAKPDLQGVTMAGATAGGQAATNPGSKFGFAPADPTPPGPASGSTQPATPPDEPPPPSGNRFSL